MSNYQKTLVVQTLVQHQAKGPKCRITDNDLHSFTDEGVGVWGKAGVRIDDGAKFC